jgi:pyruvate/2-oxoglutarate dehydrogenase complex dihydrolipoamide acyltransferase (E2) component
MTKENGGFTLLPYPRTRLLMVDGGQRGLRKHTVHGLFEFDVTEARRALRRHRAETGEALSFAAFFLSCLGRAIDADRSVQAYRAPGGKLLVFDEVDVNMLFEVEVDGVKTIRPHILRRVNRKGMRELQEEIRAFQAGHEDSRESRFIDAFVRLPGFLRRLFLGYLFRDPRRVKELYGTVMVSSLGLFGSGGGWGIPVPNHSLQLTLGTVGEKPGLVGQRVEPRQYLCLTLSFDHDIIDGAPAARFIQRLKRLVEGGAGIGAEAPAREATAAEAPAGEAP